MKRIFLFLGRNTVPTIVVSIVTLVVFSTSVYGFVKAANINAPIDDVPEVKTVEQKLTENISPAPSLAPEENSGEGSQGVFVENSESLASPTPSEYPAVVSGQSNQQDNQAQDRQSARGSQNQRVIVKNGSAPEIDNDVEDVGKDNDSDRDSGGSGDEEDEGYSGDED